MNNFSEKFCNVPIYWINLDDSEDRRNKMVENLKYNSNKRIQAVDGRDCSTFYQRYSITHNKTTFNTALIAVVCSHVKAIKTAFDDGLQNVCIFEDDTNFELAHLFPHTLNDIMHKHSEWECIQLFFSNKLPDKLAHYKRYGLTVLPRDFNYSGTCYVINRAGMQRILTEMVDTDGDKKFIFKKDVRDPETTFFTFLKTYVINLPFVYYYSESMTFTNYFAYNSNLKLNCQGQHLDAKKILTDFYDQNFKTNG